MTPEPSDHLPDVGGLHCPACGKVIPCTPDALHGYIQDDSSWPRCCSMKMAVVLKSEDPDDRR